MLRMPKKFCSRCHKTKNHPIGVKYARSGRPSGETENVKALRSEMLKLRTEYNCSNEEIAWHVRKSTKRVYQVIGAPPEGFNAYDENFVMPPRKKKRRSH